MRIFIVCFIFVSIVCQRKLTELSNAKAKLESLLQTGMAAERRGHIAQYEAVVENMLKVISEANGVANQLLQQQLEGLSSARY